jgi:hypothetical protein
MFLKPLIITNIYFLGTINSFSTANTYFLKPSIAKLVKIFHLVSVKLKLLIEIQQKNDPFSKIDSFLVIRYRDLN